MRPSTAAEQRALAIAKIRRATALPRLSNGLRPRMHVEAVSEGEDSGADGDLSDDSPMMSKDQGPRTEEEPIVSPFATLLGPEGTPTKPRQRSRARSGGRGSKDLEFKVNVSQASLPINAVPFANESSPDEGPVSSIQPTSFTPTSPMSPTFQDVQRQGLQRGLSNIAPARLMAFQKLTGPEAVHNAGNKAQDIDDQSYRSLSLQLCSKFLFSDLSQETTLEIDFYDGFHHQIHPLIIRSCAMLITTVQLNGFFRVA